MFLFRFNGENFRGKSVILLGWGSIQFAGSKSDILQKAEVSVVACPDDSNLVLCNTGNGKDSCQVNIFVVKREEFTRFSIAVRLWRPSSV